MTAAALVAAFLQIIALLLSGGMALAVDWLAARRLPAPPGLRHAGRRAGASAVLTVVLFFTVFLPLVSAGQGMEIDPATLSPGSLFLSQIFLLLGLGAWCLLAYGIDAGDLRAAIDALGLRLRRPWRELGVGLGAGLLAWLVVLVAAVVFGLLLELVLGEEALAQQLPAPLIVWMAGLPVVLRLALSLSAGLVEEIFFRGFLQPRIGIGASTLLFVLGHAAYGQPLMLVSLTVLSLLYAALARWRGNVWSAVVAHALFDAVQLLVVIPFALRALEGAG